MTVSLGPSWFAAVLMGDYDSVVEMGWNCC